MLIDRTACWFHCTAFQVGRLAIGGGNQVPGHQQQGRQYQSIDHRDRNDANGEAAVAIVKVGSENIANRTTT